MSEETHEERKVVEVEGPTRPRRRRRRNRNPGDGSSEPNTTGQDSSESLDDTKVSAVAAAPEASASQPAGDEAPKPKARRRRRKTRSKRQAEPGSAEASPEPVKAASQPEAKKSEAKKSEPKKSEPSKQKSSTRSQSQDNQNRSKQQPQPARARQRPKSQSRANVYKPRTPESKFGGREPLVTSDFEEERSNEPLKLTPFELFCTYHLGISEDNRYRPSNIRDVARRFAVSQGELEQALKDCGLDRDSMRKIGYDMSLAQLDMQVAPEGIDKRELAKVLFSELVEMSPEIERSVAAAEQVSAPVAEEQRAED